MKIQITAIEKVVPYARNPRRNQGAIAKVAASIKEFGWQQPIVVDSEMVVIAGHTRLAAAQSLGMSEVPIVVAENLTPAQVKAYRLADNRVSQEAEWDHDLLTLELQDLLSEEYDLDLTGFSDDELAALLAEETEGLTDEDTVPEVPENPVTVPGDVWLLGKHRLMCGDSTSISDVEKLMDGATAQLLHADPPYGMGKTSDGVANDNIYDDELDQFQMEWWATFRTFLVDNASAYIWGNAPDLWRLWYCGGLGDSERLELRNQIVWDKKSIAGMKSDHLTQYPIATEHALFFQIGQQFIGNINADDFPESWEVVRSYMEQQAKSAGMASADVKRICGVSMYGHWFTRSQFNLIPEKRYRALAEAYPGHFARPWRDLKAEWDRVKGGPTSEIQGARSYFDNAHDVMRDVWEFQRVTGDERHGHATPKPVAMMERVMKSSLPKGGLCVEPFGGSGATLMGAEKTGRVCYTMELQGHYCDVIIKRWQDFTGKKAVHAETGEEFDG
jgi:DNA modification methylase